MRHVAGAGMKYTFRLLLIKECSMRQTKGLLMNFVAESYD